MTCRNRHRISVLVVHDVPSRSCASPIRIHLRSHQCPDMVLYWSVHFPHVILSFIFIALDRLLPSRSSLPSIPPFSQEECRELLTLLRSFNREPFHSGHDSLTYISLPDLSAQTVSVLRTRVVSKVLVHFGKVWLAHTLPGHIYFCLVAWRIDRFGGGATFQNSWRNGNGPSARTPFLRTAGDFIIPFVCLGVFLERLHHQRFDTGAVRSSAGPILVVGALACLIMSRK